MTTPTVYGYMKCDSCRKALKWFESRGVETAFVDITTDPPSAALLGEALDAGAATLAKLFNTSGRLYRERGIKDKLLQMTRDEALDLLAGEGMLVKRPVVTDGRRFTVGFKEAVFEEVWA